MMQDILSVGRYQIRWMRPRIHYTDGMTSFPDPIRPVALSYYAPYVRTHARHAYGITTDVRSALLPATTGRITFTDSVQLQGAITLGMSPPHPVAVRSSHEDALLALAEGGRRSLAAPSPLRTGIAVSDADEYMDELELSDYIASLDAEPDDESATWDALDLTEGHAWEYETATDDYGCLAYGMDAADDHYDDGVWY